MTTRASAELITAELRRQVEAGQYQPGMALPSKSALRRQYGCSNDVAQAVFNNLAAEGLIVTRTGAGAFVRAPAAFLTLDAMVSGFPPPTASRTRVPRWVADIMSVDPGVEVDRFDAALAERAHTTWRHPTKTGAPPELVETQVQARAGTADERGLLGLRPGTPVLVVVRVHRAKDGTAMLVERVTSVGAAHTLALGDTDG